MSFQIGIFFSLSLKGKPKILMNIGPGYDLESLYG